MRDFVKVTRGQEHLFCHKAQELGYRQLVLVYDEQEIRQVTSSYKQALRAKISIELFFAVVVKKHTTNYVQADIHIGLGTTITALSSHLDYLYYLEYDTRQDGLHQRRSGTNHVLLERCKEKHIGLLWGYSDACKNKLPRVLGRVIQNNKLARKHNVVYRCASMACHPLDMRSYGDVQALQLQLE